MPEKNAKNYCLLIALYLAEVLWYTRNIKAKA